MRIIVAVLILLAGSSLGGCYKDNPNYCPGAPDNNCFGDAGPDAIRCTLSSTECICHQGFCVQCTAEDEHNCTGTTPQCGSDNRCRGCIANDDCGSGACLEDGACADAGRVVYAAANGTSNAGCGTQLGQNECSIAQAVAEVNGSRNIIRLAAGLYTVTGTNGLEFSNRSGTLIARAATIKNLNGAILSVHSAQTLKVVGGTLQGQNNADGIRCFGGGKLEVHQTTIENMSESGLEGDSCPFTVSRATIRNNLGGGIRMINAAQVVTIKNNFVYRNGTSGSTFGGMDLRLASGSKLELNTVVSNTANSGANLAGGITCDANGYNAPRNLIYRNQGGVGGAVQVIGSCTFQESYARPAGAPDENSVGFENPNALTDPSFSLTATSPVGDVRDAFSCTGEIDFDGDRRPQGGTCDLGADEYRAGQ